MKIKLQVFFLFLMFHFGFSQTEKLIQAKVFCENFPLQGIEVLNLASKRTTITDSNGKFSIMARERDTLMFVSKNYEYKRFFLKKEDLENNNLIISLTRKPEKLEEVKVFKMPNIKLSKDKAYEQGKIDELVLEKAARNPKPIGVYDGTLVNSPDLIRIGGMILSLFKKKNDTPKKVSPEIKIKDIVITTYEEDFFVNKLKLKPDEIALFLQFCDADPESKTVLKKSNPLKSMDFLMSKKIEFEKMLTSENK